METHIKTYTNSEVMDLMEQGYFVEGDKIHCDLLTLEFGVSVSGERPGFCSNHKGQIVFAKGDRWRLELVDRWEECTVQEAADLVNNNQIVKCDLRMFKEVMEIVNKSEWDKFVLIEDIAFGNWQKKVSR